MTIIGEIILGATIMKEGETMTEMIEMTEEIEMIELIEGIEIIIGTITETEIMIGMTGMMVGIKDHSEMMETTIEEIIETTEITEEETEITDKTGQETTIEKEVKDSKKREAIEGLW